MKVVNLAGGLGTRLKNTELFRNHGKYLENQYCIHYN